MASLIAPPGAPLSDLSHSENGGDGARIFDVFAHPAELVRRKKLRQRYAERRALAHKHRSEPRTHRDQKGPDKQFQPVDCGHVARPQIVPARHGDSSPLAPATRSIT